MLPDHLRCNPLKLSSLLIAFAAACLCVNQAPATDYTANVNNMNWNTAASWIPNGVPRQGDTATIPNGIRVNLNDSTNVNIGAVTITGSGSLHVNSTAVISIGDFLNSASGGLADDSWGPTLNFYGNWTNASGTFNMGATAPTERWSGTNKAIMGFNANMPNMLFSGSYVVDKNLVIGSGKTLTVTNGGALICGTNILSGAIFALHYSYFFLRHNRIRGQVVSMFWINEISA